MCISLKISPEEIANLENQVGIPLQLGENETVEGLILHRNGMWELEVRYRRDPGYSDFLSYFPHIYGEGEVEPAGTVRWVHEFKGTTGS